MTDMPAPPPTSPPLAQSPPPPPPPPTQAPGGEATPAPAKRSRLALVLVGLAVVALVAAVVLFFVVRSDGGGEESEPTPETEPFQEISGPIDEDEAALVLSVHLEAGQVIRVRIEPSESLDTEPFLVFPLDVAEGFAGVVGPVGMEEGMLDEPVEMLDFFGRVHEDLNSVSLRRELAGSYTIALLDAGWEGMPDADYMVAYASGTYTVVAQSYSGSGRARLIVEVWDERVDLEADLESVLDDADAHFADTPWFNEARFYEDEERYVP